MTKEILSIFHTYSTPLTRIDESAGAENGKPKPYIFTGPCADFNGVNDNERLYDKDDYLSHFKYLLEDIELNRLGGEVDHPEDFDPKMKYLSHLIRKLWYDEEKNQVWITIELLDNQYGDQVKSAVDKGMPLYISSRASGYIDRQGKVTLERIYTYDIVYRPGFPSAKLDRMNESFGIKNKNVLISKIMKEEPNELERIDEKAMIKNINAFKEQLTTITEQLKHVKESMVTKKINHAATPNVIERIVEVQVPVDSEKTDDEILVEMVDEIVESHNKLLPFIEEMSVEFQKQEQKTDELEQKLDEMEQKFNNVNEKFDEVFEGFKSTKQSIKLLENFIDKFSKTQPKTVSNSKILIMEAKKIDDTPKLYEGMTEAQSKTCNNIFGVCESLDFTIVKLKESVNVEDKELEAGDYVKVDDGVTTTVISETGVYHEFDKEEFDKAVAEPEPDYTAVTESLIAKSKAKAIEQAQKLDEANYPFYSNLNNLDKARFSKLHEVNKKRILSDVNAGVVTQANISKVIESLNSGNDALTNLMASAEPEHVRLWESLDNAQRTQVLDLYKIKGTKPGYHTRMFWESLDLKPTSTLKKSVDYKKLNDSLGYPEELVHML